MNHSFDVALANELGVYEAIIIHNFEFWINKNKANEKHFYNGKYWTYNSVKALKELFPYLSESQIRRTINGLVEKGIMYKDSFNPNPYDKTLWYAINENEITILRFKHSDLPNSSNGSNETNKSFTDKKQDEKHTDIKPNNKLNKLIAEVENFKNEYPESMLQDFINYWSESNSNGKMKFEFEKTFEVSKRLKTWKRNDDKFYQPKNNYTPKGQQPTNLEQMNYNQINDYAKEIGGMNLYMQVMLISEKNLPEKIKVIKQYQINQKFNNLNGF